MDGVKIVLTCPYCCNANWSTESQSGDFKCLECGNVCFPEDMCCCVKECEE